MTQNQINYWKMMEDKRHNIAVEQETQRYNKVVNYQNEIALAEQKRHNLESELVGLKQAKASLASAAAAQASAAAAQRQAEIRNLEYLDTQRVHSADIARQDILAQSKVMETSSIIDLNNAKTSLTYVQAETEAARGGLITVQTSLESERIDLVNAQRLQTLASTVTGSIKDVTSAAGTILGLFAS